MFFHWLACQDRYWTSQRLARRGVHHAPHCMLCDQLETMAHLLTGCYFSRMVWHELLSWIRLTPPPHPSRVASVDFVDWWQLSCHSIHTSVQKRPFSAIMLAAWCIWKHQNAIIFDKAWLSLTHSKRRPGNGHRQVRGV